MNAINIAVICGTSALAAEMERGLNLSGFTSPVPLHLVIDAPPGFALVQAQHFASQSTLVLTDNTCPEYLMDIRDAEPMALLAGGNTFQDILAALAHVVIGERHYRGLELTSCLTPTECQILRLLALGYSDKEMARQFDKSIRTIGNQVGNVLNKIGLQNRHHATLYYLALNHLRMR